MHFLIHESVFFGTFKKRTGGCENGGTGMRGEGNGRGGFLRAIKACLCVVSP